MGLFGRSRDLVGLDIGSHSLKLVELRQKGKSYELVTFGIQPLPPEAIVESAIMDSSAVAEAIDTLFVNNNVKKTDIATSVSGGSVIIKKISLPAMSEDELAESIRWEAEQYIPFPIDEVNLDHKTSSRQRRRRRYDGYCPGCCKKRHDRLLCQCHYSSRKKAHGC